MALPVGGRRRLGNFPADASPEATDHLVRLKAHRGAPELLARWCAWPAEPPGAARMFRCSACGFAADRDFNAALNLRFYGLAAAERAAALAQVLPEEGPAWAAKPPPGLRVTGRRSRK
jgi:hypothetical protein